MIKIKTLCISALATALLPLCLQAKEVAKIDLKEIKHPVKPVLWKIEGKGLKKPSYLFGTIHLSDPRVTTLHPLAQQAFDQADAVYTEIDLSPANQVAVLPFYMRKGDKTLEGIIGAEMVAALDTELKAISPALNVKPFERMNVWAITFMLPQLKSQMKGNKPLDMQLWERAVKAGKKKGALETLQGQLGRCDKLTMEEQKELLDVTLRMTKLAREKGVNPYQSILDGYLLGNCAALEKEMSKTSHMGIKVNPETNEKFLQLLLHDRNKGMAETIEKALSADREGSYFFAAGALHYIGDKSVNSLLTKAGYKVTPVVK